MAGSNKADQIWSFVTFSLFLIAGGVYIYFTKSEQEFQQDNLNLVIGPIVGLIGYAVFSGVFLKNLSHEQKGDNCYYLGFLYTLISLSMSLYEVPAGLEDSGDSDRYLSLGKLLFGFSIAVVSTIVGIFLRVLFHQWSSSTTRAFKVETDSISSDSINPELINALELISDKFEESAEVNKALTDNSIKIVASLNEINQKLTEFTTSNKAADNDLKPVVNELVEVTRNVSDQNAQLLEINRKQENLLESTQVNLSKQTESLNAFVAENETKPLMKELVSVVKGVSDQNSELVKIAKDQGNHLNKISESMDKNSEAEAKIMSDSKKLLSKIDRRLDAIKVNFIIFTLSRFKKLLRIFRGK